ADPGTAEPRARSRSPACHDADAANGHRGDLPQTAYEHPSALICDIPILADGSEDRAAQSRVAGRSDVPADGAWLPVSGGHHRCGKSQDSVLESIQHDDARFLRGGAE